IYRVTHQILASDRNHSFAEQKLQRSLRPYRPAMMDSNVEVLLLEQERTRPDSHVDANGRVLVVETRQPRNQPFHAESGQHRQFEIAPAAAMRRDRHRVFFQYTQRGTHLLGVQPARSREHYALLYADKQGDAEILLQEA